MSNTERGSEELQGRVTRITRFTSPEKTQDAIRRVCRDRLAAGNNYVKTSHVKRAIHVDALPQKITANMKFLEERGELEQYRQGVWRITLDGCGVAQEDSA